MNYENWFQLTNDLTKALSGENRFLVDIEYPTFKENPYFQGYTEVTGEVTIEMSSSKFVTPEFSPSQESRIRAIGWNSPSLKLPNFVQFLGHQESDPSAVADLIVRSLNTGLGLDVKRLSVSFHGS